MTLNVKATYLSHKKCFICKKPNSQVKLHKVHKNSVLKAYSKYKIFIKPHLRCCRRHLDKFGQIEESEILKIETLIKPLKNNEKLMLEIFGLNSYSIFDQFRDISCLEEDHCLKITGWTITELLNFSKYITSINESKGRNKLQLIALYRYWLRKGIDQNSLALMYGNFVTQNNISCYLSQIRDAIYRDFVPIFLGTKKNREFYLKHNNKMTVLLHKLKHDNLAVFVDGTYTRLEKSSNNDFQYKTFSLQKLQHLIKPFIMCCADGWIIECYGPFPAIMNDAEILNYILEIDKDLEKLLKPGKTTFFLDRGFRDIHKTLQEKYSFSSKIPTCKQLEENSNDNQLNTKQANDTRLITKCRFIVEKVNGELKKFKALDFIRNTIAGHIQIDYRIACSMINYLHKPCCPNKENVELISKQLLEKSKEKNSLEFLLSKHLGRTLTPSITLNKIIDFPKLSENEMLSHIFLGCFQLKQAKAYISDILKIGGGFIFNMKMLKNYLKNDFEYENTKIIAFEIPSRHHRGENKISENLKINRSNFRNNYKVLIQYIPTYNSPDGIKAYACKCNSGLRTAGCCSHVASVIYYLSYAKYNHFRSPAQHLINIFINTKMKNLPNKPNKVKFSRMFKNNLGKKNDDELQEKGHFEKSDSYLKIKKKKNLIKESNDKIEKIIRTKGNESLSHIHNSDSINERLNSKITFNLEEQIRLFKIIFVNKYKTITIKEFKEHIPKWGGKIIYNQQKISISNTCSIDYFLLCLWCFAKFNPSLIINNQNLDIFDVIIDIILMIEKKKWNEAKALWIIKVIQLTESPINNTLSLFGTENDNFIKYFQKQQSHDIFQLCNENCKLNNQIISKDSYFIFFKKIMNQVEVYSFYSESCSECKRKVKTKIFFLTEPKFIFIKSAFDDIFIQDIPDILSFDQKNFKLICTTIYQNNLEHFKAVFNINETYYLVDDLKRSLKKISDKKDIKLPTSFSVYILI